MNSYRIFHGNRETIVLERLSWKGGILLDRVWGSMKVEGESPVEWFPISSFVKPSKLQGPHPSHVNYPKMPLPNYLVVLIGIK